MLSSQVGDKITLDDTRKTDRGPVVRVKACPPLNGGDSNRVVGSYGLSVKNLKAHKTGEEFDIYLADFSDCKRKTVTVKDREGALIEIKADPGWMEFVNPADRKRWEDWKTAEAKKAKA
jgi:hypothetical protein